jgi:hypothetical protein
MMHRLCLRRQLSHRPGIVRMNKLNTLSQRRRQRGGNLEAVLECAYTMRKCSLKATLPRILTRDRQIPKCVEGHMTYVRDGNTLAVDRVDSVRVLEGLGHCGFAAKVMFRGDW